MALVTFPDKNTGDTLSAAELTQLKKGVNILASSGYPEAGTLAGTGKYNNGYTSTDGTAGLQTQVNAFDEGGELALTNALYKTTVPLVITTAATGGHGTRAGFNQDPNASALGVKGTRVQVAGTFAKWGNTNDGDRIGNNGWEKTYFYGDYSGANSIVHRFEGRLDQAFFTRNHYSNFDKVYYMPPGDKGGNLDTCTFQNEDALYNNHVFYDDGSRPSFFTKFKTVCYSDNKGFAIFVGNANRPTADLLCQAYTVEDGTFARNAGNGGAAVDMAAPGSKIVGNLFRDTGLNFLTNNRAVADCLRLRGREMVAQGNTFRGNTTGTNIVVLADDCQILYNSYAGAPGETANGATPVNSSTTGTSSNKQPIRIAAGVKRTIIWEPTLTASQIVDQGDGTMINGLVVLSGDPNTTGAWANFPKPEGSRFFDTAAGKIYEYRAAFSGGRRAGDAIAGTPQPSAGQINWFRFVNTTQSLAGDGTVTLAKTLGSQSDATSGAVSTKAISTASDSTIPAFTLTVNNAGITENYARFIGLVRFADIGTSPSGERALEMPNRLYYDFEKFLVTINGTDKPVHKQLGTIQLVGYAQTDPNTISRLDLVYNGTAIESYPNLSIPLPLAIDARLDLTNASIIGATLSAQKLIDTPSA